MGAVVSSDSDFFFGTEVFLHLKKCGFNLNGRFCFAAVTSNVRVFFFVAVDTPKTNITIEKQPFEDAFPINNGDFPLLGKIAFG